MMKEVKHFKALDGARGYAALIVTIYHAILHFSLPLIPNVLEPSITDLHGQAVLEKLILTFLNGGTAVLLFYVLSGFVLHYSLLAARELNHKEIGLFVIRRLFRLYPAIFFCMLVMYTGTHFISLFWPNFPVLDAFETMKNALLYKITVHGPSTSIQIELLATPFILFMAVIYCRYSVIMALVLWIFSMEAIQQPALTLHLPNMSSNLFAFMTGMLMATPEMKIIFQKNYQGSTIVLILLFALLGRALLPVAAIPGFFFQVICLAIFISLIAYGGQSTFVHRFLENKYSQFLGKISYSYYLLNVAVMWVFVFSPYTLANTDEFSQSPFFYGFVYAFLIMALSIPFAYISYMYVEKPFIRFGKYLTEQLRQPSLSIREFFFPVKSDIADLNDSIILEKL
ncbi:acyltransferase family protein [Legionella quinlivanii]|nr:acyltransferase [Legionella quinlivanii]